MRMEKVSYTSKNIIKPTKLRDRLLAKEKRIAKPPLNSSKPSVYYLVGKNEVLVPNSGCSINELNFIKVISKFTDV